MNTWKRKIAVILAGILLFAALFSFLPAARAEVKADDSVPSIWAGTGALKKNANKANAQTVWYGGREWYVIGYDGTGNAIAAKSNAVTLVQKEVYESRTFAKASSSTNVYKGSNLQSFLTGDALSIFSDVEKAAMKSRTLKGGGGLYNTGSYNNNLIRGEAVTDTLWPLSYGEASDMPSALRNCGTAYLLRSPGRADGDTAYILSDGTLSPTGAGVGSNTGVRPAFDIDPSSVAFTSQAVGGKPFKGGGEGALKEPAAYTGSAWKLTLYDQSRNDFKVKFLSQQGRRVFFRYSGAKVGNNEYVSAAILNSSNELTYYAKIYKPKGASMDFVLDVGGIFHKGDRLYIFSEQDNGDNKTDYISQMCLLSDVLPTVTVTFDVKGHGTAPEPQVLVYEGTVTKPDDPTATGYTFGGWYTNPSCTIEFDWSTTIPQDITLYAKWIPNTYTVSFNANGHGTAPASQSVKYNEKATKPKDPTADGYTFGGWYTNSSCTGSAFDFSTPITKSIVLYAKWSEAGKYTVSFELNGGICNGVAHINAQTVKHGEKAVKPTDPTRQGFKFEGWYSDSALTKAFDFSTPITANIRLYAKWSGGTKCGDNLYWSVTNGVLTINGTGPMWDFDADDPGYYDYRDQITAVDLKEGMTTIGGMAFFGIDHVTKITVPDSVTEIRYCAFCGMASVQSIIIGSGVKTVGMQAFWSRNDSSHHHPGSITFTGSAPTFGNDVFLDLYDAFIYYPGDDDTWTKDIMLQYGGDNIQWVPVMPDIPITGFSLNRTALEIPADSSETLIPQFIPADTTEKELTWKSSNAKIAAVDANGKVTGKSQGTATITVTSAKNSSIKATCKVTVLFKDVTDKKKAVYDAVYTLAAKGVVKGYGSYFDVNGQCTRAQFVLFLWRLAGKPEPKSTDLKFSDAADIKKLAADYTKAIAWGNEKGIVMGYTSGANKGKFKPNDPCTRGQVVLFLWRYKGRPAVSGSITFKDADEINKMAPDYAKAILWANAKKITTGYSDNTFRPNRNCTRGECVTFLYRM